MKIAVGNDELYEIHKLLLDDLKARNFEIQLFGALKTSKEACRVGKSQKQYRLGDVIKELFFGGQ